MGNQNPDVTLATLNSSSQRAQGLFSGETAKRCFDIAVSLSMLVLFAPLMLFVGLAIYLTDGLPVIYAHRRIGRRGAPFPCLKFRTMARDSDAVLGQVLASNPEKQREWVQTQKLVDDPRVLGKVGRFLRRTSLDELPQIYNVLRGEMSVVGPRPVIQQELERYGPAVSRYLSVRPGLTGPWQIGGRSTLSYDQRVALDVAYIEDWSLGMDIRIVLKTAKLLSGSDNAV